ncbi:MAG: hypothetical protein NC925_04255 [Candidatus Omnitrophica bacterium]|nr:hypothetical protein [Candidatus Omnitrophota bacterium]
MKEYLNIKQSKCLEFNLDVKEAIIVNWFESFASSGFMKSEDGFFWVAYSKVISDLPILGIKTTKQIKRIFDSLIEKKVFEKRIINNYITVFKLSEKWYGVGQECLGGLDIDVQGGGTNMSEGVGQECPPIVSYNSKLNIDSYNKDIFTDTEQHTTQNCIVEERERTRTKKERERGTRTKKEIPIRERGRGKGRGRGGKAKAEVTPSVQITRRDFMLLKNNFGDKIAAVVLKYVKNNIKAQDSWDVNIMIKAIKTLNDPTNIQYVVGALNKGLYFSTLNKAIDYAKQQPVQQSEHVEIDKDLEDYFKNHEVVQRLCGKRKPNTNEIKNMLEYDMKFIKI